MEASLKYVPPYELERQYHEEAQAAIQEVEKESKRKIKESLQKGLKKGRQEGKSEGIETRNLEIAKQMLQDGEPMEKIQKWTGLSEAEINALK